MNWAAFTGFAAARFSVFANPVAPTALMLLDGG